jgi:hypothetical protein
LKKRQHTTPTKQINKKKSKKEIKRGWGKLGKEGLFSGNDFATKKREPAGAVYGFKASLISRGLHPPHI